MVRFRKDRASLSGSIRRYHVLLTYPADGFRFFDSMIPMGIASIAACLEQAGFLVKVVDFNHYHGDFRRDLARWRPQIVGIGGTTPTRKGGFFTARVVKQVLPDSWTVYGGPHASFAASDTLNHIPDMDFVIRGEAECPLTLLCEKFVRKKDIAFSEVKGLCYRSNGKIVENGHSRIDDLSSLPLPARHLFPGEYPMKLDFFGVPADFLLTSRGCPVSCSFCSASRMFPGGVRYRNMESIRLEIDRIVANRNIGALKVFDSTFTSKEEHVLAFCQTITPYNLLWECEIRADTVDRKMLTKMRDAGCRYVNMGLETSTPRLLSRISKKISIEQVVQSLRWCRELGIRTKLFMIFGHPGQTWQECENDLEFLRQHSNEIDFLAANVGMRIYPGTRLETELRRAGFLDRDFSWATYTPPFRNWALMEFGDVPILLQTTLGARKLVKVFVGLLLNRMVMPRGYLKRILLQNVSVLFDWIGKRVRFAGQSFSRWVHPIPGAASVVPPRPHPD